MHATLKLATLWTFASIAFASPNAVAQSSLATQPFADRIEAACDRAVAFLSPSVKAGHAEVTASPPAVRPPGAPPWGMTTASVVMGLRREGGWRVQSASDWLDTAPVAPEARSWVTEARYGRSKDRASSAAISTYLQQQIERFSGQGNAASDEALIDIARSVRALEWMKQYSELPDPPDRLWAILLKKLIPLQNAQGGWGRTTEANVETADAVWRLCTRHRTLVSPKSVAEARAAVDRAWDAIAASDLIRPDPATLEAIQRAAISTGRQYAGGKDWFRAGSEYLLSIQNADGSFGAAANAQYRLMESAAALRFLLARRNLLGFGVFRPQKAAAASQDKLLLSMPNLIGFASQWSCQYVDWERVSVDSTVEDLQALRVILLTGKGPMVFTDPEVTLLRSYVERGGLLLCMADGGDPNTLDSYRLLGERMFPKYPLREMDKNHSFYVDGIYRDLWRQLSGNVAIKSSSNGMRELMLVVTGDPAASWHWGEQPNRLWAFRLAVSALFLSERSNETGSRINRYADIPAPKPGTLRTVEVAVLSPSTGIPPEPYAWRRLGRYLAADGIEVVANAADLSQLDPRKQKLLHITGVGSFELKPESRAAIAAYVKGGGTLLIEAANRDKKFADSVRSEILPSLGQPNDSDLPLLAEDDPLAVAILAKSTRLQYRPKLVWSEGRPKGLTLRALKIDGRIGVIHSDLDLSAGMAGARHFNITGYDVESATEIVRQIVLSLK